MRKLTEPEIEARLTRLSGWERDREAIRKQWSFADFREAIRFILRVADVAERLDHHPELFNVYNRVELRFSTHDAGGLTERDFQIAREIDAISSP